jgi:MFS transporter, DHA1 family, multidrug resistance protein
MIRRVVGSADAVTRVTVAGIFVVSIGNFAVAPLLALALSVHEHFSTVQIGSILTVMAICQQGLTFLFGIAGDRCGVNQVLLAGIAARIVGYGLMAGATRYGQFLAAGALVGVGGALFTPASKAVIALRATDARTRADGFALRSVALNAGAALGPLVGAAVFSAFRIAFVLAAGTYVLLLVAFLTYARGSIPRQAGVGTIRAQTIGPLVDRRLLRLTASTIGFWLLYTQFTFTIPLYARATLHAGGGVGLLYTLNAIVVILLQVAALRWATQRFSQEATLAFGTALVACAFGLLAFPPSIALLIAFGVVFSIGELLVVPTIDSLASDLAPAGATAAYLGFVALGWGGGSLLGNLGGGAAYALAGRAASDGAFWGGCCAIGLISAAAALGLGRARRTPGARANPAAS